MEKNLNLNLILAKIDRVFAWILLICIFLYFVSGYGLTKGIIDRTVSSELHLGLLSYVTAVSFIIHSGLGVRLAFMRWKLWNRFTAVFLFLLCVAFFIGVFYCGLVYKVPTSSLEGQMKNVSTTENPQEKVFSKEELSRYNGLNGMPAYAAVDGVVYDLSEVFSDGKHYDHIAGQELSNTFYLKHVRSQLTKYPVVGRLKQ